MKKLMLIGRVAAGKTTLTQALRGEEIKYFKTQYVNYLDTVIDTPGEYTERRETSGALALYAYEADVVGLVLSATDEYSIFPPACAPVANRPVVGVVTQCDKADARPDVAAMRLWLSGCERIFLTSATDRRGIDELLEYLNS